MLHLEPNLRFFTSFVKSACAKVFLTRRWGERVSRNNFIVLLGKERRINNDKRAQNSLVTRFRSRSSRVSSSSKHACFVQPGGSTNSIPRGRSARRWTASRYLDRSNKVSSSRDHLHCQDHGERGEARLPLNWEPLSRCERNGRMKKSLEKLQFLNKFLRFVENLCTPITR